MTISLWEYTLTLTVDIFKSLIIRGRYDIIQMKREELYHLSEMEA